MSSIPAEPTFSFHNQLAELDKTPMRKEAAARSDGSSLHVDKGGSAWGERCPEIKVAEGRGGVGDCGRREKLIGEFEGRVI